MVTEIKPKGAALANTGRVILREHVGDVLRRARIEDGRTLRDVSAAAGVSLGYLSEVERGQKEPSSELLASICKALDLRQSVLLGEVTQRVAAAEARQQIMENRGDYAVIWAS